MARIKIEDLPAIDDLSDGELLGIFGGARTKKVPIHYNVVINHTATNKTLKKTIKKIILTLPHLSPGNYTAGYLPRNPNYGTKKIIPHR